jgi:flagella basal body P-ring formation protein FlgA
MFYSFLILLTIFFTPNEKLKKSIDEYLKNKLTQYDKYEFSIVKAPTIEGNYEIRTETKINLNSNFAYIPVKLIKPNSGVIQTYITVRLKLFKKICVTKNEIERERPISNSDIELKLMNVTDLRGTPVESADDLKGWRSKVKIEPGSILLKELMEQIPVINKGDHVTALAISGNVKVSTSAEARQDGVVGDIIYVVTKDKKQFKAKILDSNNVIVIE